MAIAVLDKCGETSVLKTLALEKFELCDALRDMDNDERFSWLLPRTVFRNALWARRSRLASVACVTAVVALFAVGPLTAQAAFRKQASANFEAEHNTNVSLSNGDDVSNQSYRVGGRMALTQDSARFSTNLNFSLIQEFNSDRDGRILPSGTVNTRWTISPKRLFWSLNNTASQTLSDALSASIIEDLATTNVLSTGPDWVIPFSALTNLRFGGRYERVDYDNDDQEDRERNNASITLSHVMNKAWSTDISRSAFWESFSETDLKIISDQIGLSFRGKRVFWRASVGESDVEDGRVTTDTSAFNIRYQIGANVSLVGAYTQALDTDIGRASALAFQRVSDIASLSRDCALDNAASGGGRCGNLPGVSVEIVDDVVRYRQDRDQSTSLTQLELATGFLSDFIIDDALFETARYSAGLQFSLKRVQIGVDYIETEERQSIDVQAVSELNQPEVIKTTTARVSLSFPISARLRSQMSAERRSPEREGGEGVGLTNALDEDRISWELRWAVEPTLQSFLRVTHTDVAREDRDQDQQLIGSVDADSLRYVLGFTYNFQ